MSCSTPWTSKHEPHPTISKDFTWWKKRYSSLSPSFVKRFPREILCLCNNWRVTLYCIISLLHYAAVVIIEWMIMHDTFVYMNIVHDVNTWNLPNYHCPESKNREDCAPKTVITFVLKVINILITIKVVNHDCHF